MKDNRRVLKDYFGRLLSPVGTKMSRTRQEHDKTQNTCSRTPSIKNRGRRCSPQRGNSIQSAAPCFSRGARRARQPVQFCSVLALSSSCLQVPCQVPVIQFPCPVPAQFLSSSSPCSCLLVLVLARVCFYTPPKSSPAACAFRRAGPKACRAPSVFSAKFSSGFWIGFLSTFGRFWLPKMAPKPPFFLSLFWLIFLTPNCTKKYHF